VKASGGYTIFPPSIHPSGNEYRWERTGKPHPCPEWMLDLIRRPQPGNGADSTGTGDGITPGKRNRALIGIGGLLRRHCVGEDGILAALLAENRKRCKPPLDESEVRRIAKSAASYEPTGDEVEEGEQRVWPELKEEALYGAAGRWVRLISPHTEADAVALLVQFLAAYGSTIGRGAWTRAEADLHYCNIYSVLVGETAKGRKGTSEGHVRAVYSRIDGEWVEKRIHSGLSSGEGVIHCVRDAVEEVKPRRGEHGLTYESVITDAGVQDKRVLIVEGEFASTLRVLQRDGNTLSPVLRNAWDGKPLETLTKNNKNRCQSPHVSVVGHITREELLRYMDDTEKGNGFGNRFLVGLRPAGEDVAGGRKSRSGRAESRRRRAGPGGGVRAEGRRDPPERGGAGGLGRRLSRSEPGEEGPSRRDAGPGRGSSHAVVHDLRAIGRNASVVNADHLTAALALWEYVESSAKWIFGAMAGDPVADRILAAVREADEGLTRTDIYSGLFGRNTPAGRIDAALRPWSSPGTFVWFGTRREGRADRSRES
jgi:hypothetical protein